MHVMKVIVSQGNARKLCMSERYSPHPSLLCGGVSNSSLDLFAKFIYHFSVHTLTSVVLSH